MNTITISAEASAPKQPVTTRIKTFEDACRELSLPSDIATVGLCDGLESLSKSVVAQIKLSIIARALNEGWSPDWDNEGEYKWFPWFRLAGDFSFNCAVFIHTHSFVGSRLCFKSSDLAKHAGTQFLHLYKDLMTL